MVQDLDKQGRPPLTRAYMGNSLGWVERVGAPVINMADLGAQGDGVAPNDAQLARAFAMALLYPTGCTIHFPAGKYLFNSAGSFTYPSGIYGLSISGDGRDNTILYWPNANGGLVLNYTAYTSSSCIHDICFSTGRTNGGTALSLQLALSLANPALTSITDIAGCTFRGDDFGPSDYWTTCVAIGNVSNINFDSCLFLGAAGVLGNGITLVGLPGSATYGVSYYINQSMFIDLGLGISYGSYIQGVTVTATEFIGCNVGISVPASQTGALDELLVANASFNVFQNGIITQTVVSNVQVTNSLFNFAANCTAIDILGNIIAIGNCSVQGSSTTGSFGVIIPGGSAFIAIDGNVITGCGTGLAIQANAQLGVYAGNTFFANTSAITNSSNATSNIITNNQGYNPVGISAAANVGASPATITAGPSPETHYLKQSATNTATVAKGGQQIAALVNSSTYYVVELGPNESYVVTWATTQPTFTRDIH